MQLLKVKFKKMNIDLSHEKSTGRKTLTILSLIVFILVMGDWLYSIVRKVPTLWFYVDEWWVVRLVSSNSISRDYLIPFNEHLSLVPLLVYKSISRFFTMESYSPYYIAMLIPLLLTCLFFAYVLKKEYKTPLWVTFLVSTLFLVNGPGAPTLVWAFQMGVTIQTLIFSLLFAIRYIKETNKKYLVYGKPIVLSLLLVISALTSGAFPFLLLAYFMIYLKVFNLLRLITTAVPSTTIFVLWYFTYGKKYPGPALGITDHPELIWQFPKFFIGMLFFSVNTFSPTTYLNILLILMIAVTAVFGDKNVRRIILVCVLVEVFFAFVTTWNRVSLGFPLTGSGHYQYLQSAFLFIPVTISIAKLVEFRHSKYLATKYLTTVVFLGFLGTIYTSQVKFDSMINWRSQVDASIKNEFTQACSGSLEVSKIGESAKVFGFNIYPGQIDEKLILDLRNGKLFPISCKHT